MEPERRYAGVLTTQQSAIQWTLDSSGHFVCNLFARYFPEPHFSCTPGTRIVEIRRLTHDREPSGILRKNSLRMTKLP
jgi:hypothetical protein